MGLGFANQKFSQGRQSHSKPPGADFFAGTGADSAARFRGLMNNTCWSSELHNIEMGQSETKTDLPTEHFLLDI